MPAYVEKVRVPVRLAQPNLAPRDGWFLLFPCVGAEQRTESLVELLNSRRSVIPFIPSGDVSVLLLTRSNIDWVAVSPGVEPTLVFPPGLERNQGQRVGLRFLDESRVEATIDWFSERGQERLSDYLNVCDTFVVGRTGFGTLIWNKQRIREVQIASDDVSRARSSPFPAAQPSTRP